MKITIIPVMPDYRGRAEEILDRPGEKFIEDADQLKAVLELARERGVELMVERRRRGGVWPLTRDEALECIESFMMELRGTEQ